MHSNLLEIVKEVVTSWQVIAVTLAILVYINIVSYVSKRYHTPRAAKVKKVKTPKQKAKPAAQENLDDLPASDSNDELGLEEA